MANLSEDIVKLDDTQDFQATVKYFKLPVSTKKYLKIKKITALFISDDRFQYKLTQLCILDIIKDIR